MFASLTASPLTHTCSHALRESGYVREFYVDFVNMVAVRPDIEIWGEYCTAAGSYERRK